MTLTGFLYLGAQLLGEAGWDVAYTLGEITANWWVIAYAALVLGFPSGRISGRTDWAIVGAFAFGTGAPPGGLAAVRARRGDRDQRVRATRTSPRRSTAGRAGSTGRSAFVLAGVGRHALAAGRAAAAAPDAADARRLRRHRDRGRAGLLPRLRRRVHPRQRGGDRDRARRPSRSRSCSACCARSSRGPAWPTWWWRCGRRPTRSSSASCCRARCATRRSSSSTGCPASSATSTRTASRSRRPPTAR